MLLQKTGLRLKNLLGHRRGRSVEEDEDAVQKEGKSTRRRSRTRSWMSSTRLSSESAMLRRSLNIATRIPIPQPQKLETAHSSVSSVCSCCNEDDAAPHSSHPLSRHTSRTESPPVALCCDPKESPTGSGDAQKWSQIFSPSNICLISDTPAGSPANSGVRYKNSTLDILEALQLEPIDRHKTPTQHVIMPNTDAVFSEDVEQLIRETDKAFKGVGFTLVSGVRSNSTASAMTGQSWSINDDAATVRTSTAHIAPRKFLSPLLARKEDDSKSKKKKTSLEKARSREDDIVDEVNPAKQKEADSTTPTFANDAHPRRLPKGMPGIRNKEQQTRKDRVEADKEIYSLITGSSAWDTRSKANSKSKFRKEARLSLESNVSLRTSLTLESPEFVRKSEETFRSTSTGSLDESETPLEPFHLEDLSRRIVAEKSSSTSILSTPDSPPEKPFPTKPKVAPVRPRRPSHIEDLSRYSFGEWDFATNTPSIPGSPAVQGPPITPGNSKSQNPGMNCSDRAVMSIRSPHSPQEFMDISPQTPTPPQEQLQFRNMTFPSPPSSPSPPSQGFQSQPRPRSSVARSRSSSTVMPTIMESSPMRQLFDKANSNDDVDLVSDSVDEVSPLTPTVIARQLANKGYRPQRYQQSSHTSRGDMPKDIKGKWKFFARPGSLIPALKIHDCLNSTPYTLTAPGYRHGEIRLLSRLRMISSPIPSDSDSDTSVTYRSPERSKTNSFAKPKPKHKYGKDHLPKFGTDDGMDWTAFQIAISGNTDDQKSHDKFRTASDAASADYEAIYHLDIDSIFTWWDEIGLPLSGLVGEQDELAKNIPEHHYSFQTRRDGLAAESFVRRDMAAEATEAHETEAKVDSMNAEFRRAGLGKPSSRPQSMWRRPSGIPDILRIGIPSPTQRVIKSRSHRKSQRDSKMKLGTRNMALNLSGDRSEDDDSGPPSPLDSMMTGDGDMVPMGFNLSHDIGDFLRWEKEFVGTHGTGLGTDGVKEARFGL